MKKKLVSLILLISLKTLGDNCTTYAGIIEFCQDREVACFINFVNATNQLDLLKNAKNCPVITNAISSSPNLADLQNNASTIVQDVIKTYLFNNGGGCQDLVENYIDYAKNCSGTLAQYCDAYSKGLSFGQSNCRETLRAAQGAVNVAESILPGSTNPAVHEQLRNPENWRRAAENVGLAIAGKGWLW
jgi:hypothetical protein